MRGTAFITAVAAGFAIASPPAATADATGAGARIQAWLTGRLAAAPAGWPPARPGPMTVLIHGTSARTAAGAARAAGLRVTRTWDAIGVAAATGPPDRIRAAAHRPGVTYLEGDRPLAYADVTSNVATRGDEARRTLTG